MHRVGNNAPVHDGLTQKKTAAASPSADYDSEEEVSLLSSLIPETVRCSPHERTYAPLIAVRKLFFSGGCAILPFNFQLLLGKENLPYILRFCSEMNKEKRETILQQLIIVFRYYHCARRIMKNIITHEVKFNRGMLPFCLNGQLCVCHSYYSVLQRTDFGYCTSTIDSIFLRI